MLPPWVGWLDDSPYAFLSASLAVMRLETLLFVVWVQELLDQKFAHTACRLNHVPDSPVYQIDVQCDETRYIM